jgi:AcrR family transcriptional regulator
MRHGVPNFRPVDVTETALAAPTRLDHLLEVARREFLARGYQRVSVEGIARAAGVSKQTIYRHFTDKADILRAIVGQANARFRGGFAVAPTASGDAAAILRACILPIRAGFVSGEARSLFRLDISIAGEFQELSRLLNNEFIASLSPIADQMEALAGRGALRIDQPMAAAAQLGGLAVEGCRYLMGFPPPRAADHGADPIVDLYLNGFAGRIIDAYGAAADDCELTAGMTDLHRAIRPHFENAEDLRLSEGELQNLMRVARRKFFAGGYRESSLEEIGAAAKVGRGTLYRWFGGKESLFAVAMLHAASEIGAARLPRGGGPAGQGLADLAFAASGVLMGRTGVRLYRTVIAEADALPLLARRVYLVSRAALIGGVTKHLRAIPAGRALSEPDLAWAAMQFLTLATDGNRYLSVDAAPTPAERRQLAARAADAFINGRRPR